MEEVIELMSFYAAYSAVLSLISIAVYVLNSLGMYTIAQRRGINNPWLAWVPVGNMWILGSIADDYRLKAKGQVKNRRKILMGLSIGALAVVPLVILFAIIGIASAAEEGLVLFVVMMVLLYLALIVVAIVMMVFQYICLYDLFASCDPNNKTLYLLLSIFIGNVSAILVFICRNKDLGMNPSAPQNYYLPPQYQQPQYQQPQYQQPQYQQPQYQQPQYQPPQYQQPQYQQPQYQQPQYQPPQQQPPQQPPYNGQ